MSVQYASLRERLEYRVGALLYVPASHKTIAEKICGGTIEYLSSVAFCLEDTIQDNALEAAEEQLCATLAAIDNDMKVNLRQFGDYPMMFIRVRTPAHLAALYPKIKQYGDLITGFILPKFDLSNVTEYSGLITAINADREAKPLYIMPILESSSIAYKETRMQTLVKLLWYLDGISDYVLNIRVGGNDFSNRFALRRNVTQTVYDMELIKDILVDILNVFSRKYVISAPVWEYFDTVGGSAAWSDGLSREVALDRLNGFVGKTAIHPSQLPVILDGLRVSRSDYLEALQILNWSTDGLAVSKGASGRMNEVKVHGEWAKKTLKLAEAYGVKNDD